MNIGLDYDDTFTRDPVAWTEMIKFFSRRGHKLYLTTWRTPEECVPIQQYFIGLPITICPTSRTAKSKCMWEKYGVLIDVWVDDNPITILQSQND